MSAPEATAVIPSPLSRVASADRQRVIDVIYQALGPHDATRVLAALAGSPREVWDLPDAVQVRVRDVVLNAFDDAHGVVVVSQLSITRVGTDTWLPALRERFADMGVDAVADEIERAARGRQAR